MRITKLLYFSNYVQIKNNKLINPPLPFFGVVNNKKKTEKEKEKERKRKKEKEKEGFPWE